MKANAVTKKIAENLNPHFRAYVICGVTKEGKKIVTALVNAEGDAAALNEMISKTQLNLKGGQ